jgi:tetrahydromethanopterin S-methyltransferase subunit G
MTASGGAERVTRADDELRRTLARINGRAWGVAMGLVLGLGLSIATVFLVIKGGPVVGPHLGLLGIFLPGYSVTWHGALFGFVYAFFIGYAIGRVIGVIYNAASKPRNSLR